ncbi:N-glycosylase/DNA lyase isoform X2 [Chanodichthys erythropterus]|uniref:N-glycosylase/DNA lyase isoform X2 n=1 Tax=Chanodichthys erythropterus TaxID=933992 RepID=UPI00351EA0B3
MSQHALLSAGCKAWRSITCPRSELRLDLTLGCGQTFRWRETADGHWTGVMRGKVWTLTQTEDMLCSNNHISRIQGMVDRLCQTLGTLLCKLDDVAYHDFPPLQDLTDPSVEMHLRDLGFGYRARFLQQSSQTIVNSHGPDWLHSLRSAPYLQTRDALRTLPGVGLKVADCVCLMSLDKFEALPVDTHVWQIAKRDYNFAAGNSQKTLTDRVYKEIGDFFRKLWGPYAGWAQSVLFCADLKKFQKLREEIPVMKDEKTELKNKMKKRRHEGFTQEQKREKGNKYQRS